MVGGAYAQDEIKIRAKAPFPLLPQSSVKKEGRIFGRLRYKHWYNCVLAGCQIPTQFSISITPSLLPAVVHDLGQA